MLYILCVTPPIITDSLHLPDAIGACGLFVFIAIATGIIIYNSMTKPRYTKMDDTFMEDFKEWQSKMTRISRQCAPLKVLCGYSLPPCTL